jgi:peptide/nickel transport system substrate-binding protein
MRFIKLHWLAAINTALVSCFSLTSMHAATSPHYGGTLRVELHATSISFDPRDWKPGSVAAGDAEKLAALVYDRLVTLDDYGKFQPALAAEWSHDPAAKNWQFRLRPGVKFSDGSPLTPAGVASALKDLLPANLQIVANESGLTIRANRATPDLLEQLAFGRCFIYRVQPDGTLLGTGPFFVAESAAASASDANPSALKPGHLKFRANEEAWAGRPFLDSIDVTLGQPPLRQLLDLQVGRADLVEIAPDLVRKALQENLRVWSSSPDTLLALRFDEAQPATADDRLREALFLALDRDTMANVLLQREAQPAAALLPPWLSGYASLFEAPMNLQRAKEIRASLPAREAAGMEPLRLRVDAVGDLYKLLGERVAVNARQADLAVQVLPHSPTNASASASGAPAPGVGLHLFAWRYASLSPRAELEALAKQLHFPENEWTAPGSDPEQLYAQERRLLEARHVLPLVVLPEYAGLASRVRNWTAGQWGEWRLADVWLDTGESAPAGAEAAKPANSSTARVPGVRP